MTDPTSSIDPVRADYLGWSGFLLCHEDWRIAIDPHWSSWTVPGQLPPWDLTPLDGIIVSHGHPDHTDDIAGLLCLHPKAWLAVPDELMDWARRLPGAEGRVYALNDTPRSVAGLEVQLLPGVHVGDGPGELRRLVLRYALRRPVSTVGLIRRSLAAPAGGTYGILLRWPDGPSVLHVSETLHRGSDRQLWASQVHDLEVDLVLLGIEPGEEEAAVALASQVKCDQLLAFSPHETTRRWYGLDTGEGVVRWSALSSLPTALNARQAAPVQGRLGRLEN